MIYNLYIDKRKDNNEVIYVGIGTDGRVQVPYRNKKHEAIKNKYGVIRDVLFKTNDYSWLQIQEILAITYYNTYTYKSKYGCNFTKGGEGGVGYRHTSETKDQLRVMATGYKHSIDSKSKISKSQTGKTYTKSQKLTMSKSKGGQAFKVYKAIGVQRSHNKTTPTVYKKGNFVGTGTNQRQCARDLEIPRTAVSNSFSGKVNHANGYMFEVKL